MLQPNFFSSVLFYLICVLALKSMLPAFPDQIPSVANSSGFCIKISLPFVAMVLVVIQVIVVKVRGAAFSIQILLRRQMNLVSSMCDQVSFSVMDIMVLSNFPLESAESAITCFDATSYANQPGIPIVRRILMFVYHGMGNLCCRSDWFLIFFHSDAASTADFSMFCYIYIIKICNGCNVGGGYLRFHCVGWEINSFLRR